MSTAIELPAELLKVKDKGAKEVLKHLSKWLTSKETAQLAEKDPKFSTLKDNLIAFTSALKDTYSPNILRFMTSKDAYIKELAASAKQVQDTVIPNAIAAAQAVQTTDDMQPLVQLLIAFQLANTEKQERVTAGKGDMVENTTHDIMQKYVKKNFHDIGELVTPIITALQK